MKPHHKPLTAQTQSVLFSDSPLKLINRLLPNNAPFNAQVPQPPTLPPLSKSRPDPVGTVSASKAGFQTGASMTCGGSVSNHLWCSRYKDCIHLSLLYTLTAAQITTLLFRDNRACVDLCCCFARGMSVHFSSGSIWDIKQTNLTMSVSGNQH